VNDPRNVSAASSGSASVESAFGRGGCLGTLNHYTQTKAVILNMTEGKIGPYG